MPTPWSIHACGPVVKVKAGGGACAGRTQASCRLDRCIGDMGTLAHPQKQTVEAGAAARDMLEWGPYRLMGDWAESSPLFPEEG
jgi:hypothetical protein